MYGLFYTFFIHLIGYRLSLCELNWTDSSITLPEALTHAIYATTSDNILYYMGGTDIYGTTQTDVRKWDPTVPETFALLSETLPTAIKCIWSNCATIINDKYMHIIGPYAQHGLHYIFDIENETFINHNIPSMPFPVEGACVKKDNNNNLYVMGGANGGYLNYLQILDTSTNTWSSQDEGIPNIPNTNGIADVPCSYYNGNMYLFGGYNAVNGYLTDIYKYEISSNTWITLATTLLYETRGGRSTVGPDGNIYIVPGHTNPNIQRFEPETEEIYFESNMITVDGLDKDHPMIFTMFNTNKIYIAGGDELTLSDTFITAYVPTCDTKGLINYFNWNTRSPLPSYYNNSITINTNDLSININIDLDYLGYSYNQFNEYGYGTVYVLSFISYDSLSLINEPNIECGENRIHSTYTELSSFSDYWRYSNNLELNNIDYTAYNDPGLFWTLSSSTNNECIINYVGNFKWTDIDGCDGIVISEDNNYINLTGHFYVSIVSPYNKDYEYGIYYVQPIYSQEFQISVSKIVNVLSNVGIRLFTMSIVDINLDNSGNQDSIQILLGTQSGDNLYLHSPQLLLSPNNDFIIGGMSNNGNCIINNSDTCHQFWEIKTNINCPYSFDSTFILKFEIGCKGISSSCQDNYNSTITLTSDLEYTHNVCDNGKSVGIKEYFEGYFKFYFHPNYTELYDETNNNHFYLIETDRVYAEIIVNNTNDTYNIFDTQLENVWICTIGDESLILDQNNPTNTGCFDVNVDYFEWIIVNHDENYYSNAQLEGNEYINNLVRFSFIPSIPINSQTLYIHAQLSISLVNKPRRRLIKRILLDAVLYEDNSNSNEGDIYHLGQYINIQKQDNDEDDDDDDNNTDDGFKHVISIPLFISTVVTFVLSV